MLYWGSKCNSIQSAEVGLAVSGGQHLFTLGLPMLALSLKYFLSFLWGPSTNIDFWCVKNIIWKTQPKSSKNSCRFKIWMGFVRQILIKMETFSIRGFLQLPLDILLGVTWANMLVATQWPLKRAPPLRGYVWYGGLEAHLSYLRFAHMHAQTPKHARTNTRVACGYI